MTDNQHKQAKKICTKCGTRLVKCIECGDWYNKNNEKHIYCLPRCKMRAHIRRKKEQENK